MTAGLAALCLLLLAPLFGASTAGAYPVTTCSTLSVSTTNPLPGEAITVTGTNFRANASVTLVLTPGNVTLKTVKAGASGAFSTKVTMPNSTTNGGNFTIKATTGNVSSANCPTDPFQTLAVQAETDNNGGGTNSGSGSGSGGLSVTGLDIAGLLALAAGLVGAGLLLNRKRSNVNSR